MNATLEKPDGRTKEARAAKAAAAPQPPASAPLPENDDPYMKDWNAGFYLVKDGKRLPEDASEAMQEGGRAAAMPAVPAPSRRRDPYGGLQVTRNVGFDDDPDPLGEQAGLREPSRMTKPAPVIPSVFVQAPVEGVSPAASGYHERRARDVIRSAHERADRETAAARLFLEFPTSASKREAFIASCDDLDEIPGAPPRTPHGDRDVSLMYWMADWHPRQFKEKYAACPAPLARQLLREIESR